MVAAVFQRSRGDALPSDRASVVLVPMNGPAGPAAVSRAVRLAAGGKVAVVAPLRIYGSSFGFPNPGLLPTRQEKEEARRAVELTIRSIEQAGAKADGQITATRRPAKVIASAARRRGARCVVIDTAPAGAFRQMIEGDLAAAVRRRLGRDAPVEAAQ
jgi:hypothetical protein